MAAMVLSRIERLEQVSREISAAVTLLSSSKLTSNMHDKLKSNMAVVPRLPRANPGGMKSVFPTFETDDLDDAAEVVDEPLPRSGRLLRRPSHSLEAISSKDEEKSHADTMSPFVFLFMPDDPGQAASNAVRGETEPVRPRGLRRRIFLRLPEGATIPVDYDLTMKVEGLRDEIGKALRLAGLLSGPLLCQLQFKGKVLSLQKSLQDCGVELGNVLHLKINSAHDSVLDVAACSLSL
eukprot:TRINITY_DN16595_c1_g1_i1.p1 TRINITY_DN16595_c1_g1~~TRINITY_DN16595_c1_g1_i1.p1  ORF type:complete len:237 (+),score=47.00 TRINITY_DN16595_c1_g1_i1:75-785(+)